MSGIFILPFLGGLKNTTYLPPIEETRNSYWFPGRLQSSPCFFRYPELGWPGRIAALCASMTIARTSHGWQIFKDLSDWYGRSEILRNRFFSNETNHFVFWKNMCIYIYKDSELTFFCTARSDLSITGHRMTMEKIKQNPPVPKSPSLVSPPRNFRQARKRLGLETFKI